jgi:hypothetical protein
MKATIPGSTDLPGNVLLKKALLVCGILSSLLYVELDPNTGMTRMSIDRERREGIVIEGTIGRLERASFIEDAILEVKGSKGTLRTDLRKDELATSATSTRNEKRKEMKGK